MWAIFNIVNLSDRVRSSDSIRLIGSDWIVVCNVLITNFSIGLENQSIIRYYKDEVHLTDLQNNNSNVTVCFNKIAFGLFIVNEFLITFIHVQKTNLKKSLLFFVRLG